MIPRIPLARPEILPSDIEAVVNVLRTDQLSMGMKLAEFEEAICEYVKSPFAVAVNSGTSALHLALKVLNIPEGSEVILPSFTFVAPLNVILQERLQPVFADIDSATLNVDPDALESAITPRTKAIIAVHTFGRPVQAGEFREIADRHGIALIEDACEALGAEIAGGKAGSFGDASALAFYPNKQITTGEGGVLLTKGKDMAARARRLRNQGRDPSLDWHQHSEAGYSYRLSEINCALGREQLRRIEQIVARRIMLAKMYASNLRHLPVMTPPEKISNGRISWFCYVIQLPRELGPEDRNWIAASLARKGIGTGRYFAPLHQQPLVKALGCKASSRLPVTEEVASRVLALPFFNALGESEVQYVCGALEESLGELARRKT